MNWKTLLGLGIIGFGLMLYTKKAKAYTLPYKPENKGVFKMPNSISEKGLNFIKKEEGLRLEPYQDGAGNWTIGYGHKLAPAEWWNTISEQFAEELLRIDINQAENAVRNLVNYPISQNQYDALVSFVYNIGPTAFSRSTLLHELNSGNVPAAENEFPKWNKITVKGEKEISKGLVARRQRERQLFMS